MSTIEIFLIAVALSIDASVVSFSQGLILDKNKLKNSLTLAFWVGFFQAFMPIIGWYIAHNVYEYIEAIDHWIAFGIFLILGVKFIYDAFNENEKEKDNINCISFKCILLLAIATSIDALAAGATLYFVNVEIFIPALIIGCITFASSLIGFWSGYLFKKFPSKWLEVFAGFILIALGVKILIEHTT